MDNTRKITKLEKTALMPVKRKRVAAYARVSSGKDAQLHSLSVQISYYNEYIGSRGDWQLVKIYADEAMTGTRMTGHSSSSCSQTAEPGRLTWSSPNP